MPTGRSASARIAVTVEGEAVVGGWEFEEGGMVTKTCGDNIEGTDHLLGPTRTIQSPKAIPLHKGQIGGVLGCMTNELIH